MKNVLVNIAKYTLIGYMVIASGFFMYLQWIRDEDEGVDINGIEAFNIKRNLNASGTVLSNMGKAFTWPYFMFRPNTDQQNR